VLCSLLSWSFYWIFQSYLSRPLHGESHDYLRPPDISLLNSWSIYNEHNFVLVTVVRVCDLFSPSRLESSGSSSVTPTRLSSKLTHSGCLVLHRHLLITRQVQNKKWTRKHLRPPWMLAWAGWSFTPLPGGPCSPWVFPTWIPLICLFFPSRRKLYELYELYESWQGLGRKCRIFCYFLSMVSMAQCLVCQRKLTCERRKILTDLPLTSLVTLGKLFNLWVL
jgi:hypothetical protein